MPKLIETTHDIEGKLFTAETFLDQLRRSNSHWWDGDEGDESCRWVFRGHKDASWQLIPSAFRDIAFNELKPLIENLKEHPVFSKTWFQEKSDSNKSAIYKYTAFYIAIQRFNALALELGLTDKIIDLNDPFFMAGAAIKPDGMAHYYKTCSHQIVSLAQHHGIPTPFLDWTRKPEVALHFASTFSSKEDIADIAIFALKVGDLAAAHPRLPDNILSAYVRPADRRKDKPVRLPFEIVLDAPAQNSYLAAQHGIFTMSSNLVEFFKSGECPALETEMSNLYGGDTILLKKFVLSKDEIPKLRLLLDREGLTEAHLMPTFDKIASAVKSRWAYS